MKKTAAIVALAAVLAIAAFCYFRFYFVFGEGVKSGELNYVVYKGVLFKTYEGKLIQSGIRSMGTGSIQSYEFEFSVEDEQLARRLMLQGGRTVELHYREYFGALPWRGFTKFIVDSIVSQPRPADSATGSSGRIGETAIDASDATAATAGETVPAAEAL